MIQKVSGKNKKSECVHIKSSNGNMCYSTKEISNALVRYPVWQHTFVSPSAFSRRAVVSYWRKYVHEVLVNRLGGLSLPRKSVLRLTDRPDMTLDVYRGRKTTIQPTNQKSNALGGNFQKNSSSSSYSQQFQSQNNENYNLPFKLSELKNSLDKANDTAAGPDDIHYQILKHLPSDALESLLNMAVFIITWNLSVYNVFYFQPKLDNLTVVSDISNCKIATSVNFYPVQ